jgi:hypothetical protein
VRSGPGAAKTILVFHIISARPSKQSLMVSTFLKVYMELGSYFVSARTNERHYHHCFPPVYQDETCLVKPEAIHTNKRSQKRKLTIFGNTKKKVF